MLIIAAALALGCLWCTEPGASLARPEHHADLSPAVRCTADVARHTLECEQSPPGSMVAGADQPARISVVLSNPRYDSRTLVYSFDSEITNFLPYPVGTPDCRSITGIKLFVEAGPTATAFYPPYDSGTVSVRDAEGFQSFTAPGQPYSLYDTILGPQQVTRPKRWEFSVPRSVSRFTFAVRVFTFTPVESGVPDTPPGGWLVPADSVAELYSFTKTVLTHPRLNGPYPRGVLTLSFTPGATREDRQSAIDAVSGRVIGGRTVFYYVVIPEDGTAEPIWAAVDKLNGLPHVSRAGPDLLTQGLVSQQEVPEVPPSGFLIPADSVTRLYAFTNAIWTHPRMSGPYPRNIIQLFFTRSSTREERQSAIDMVDGRVIGGGGVYYDVLVPTATGDALWASIDRLRALPQVTRAAPDILAQGLIPMTAPSPWPGLLRALSRPSIHRCPSAHPQIADTQPDRTDGGVGRISRSVWRIPQSLPSRVHRQVWWGRSIGMASSRAAGIELRQARTPYLPEPTRILPSPACARLRERGRG